MESKSKNYEMIKFESDRKCLSLLIYESFEIALLIKIRQSKSQNVPISGPLLIEKGKFFVEQLNLL